LWAVVYPTFARGLSEQCDELVRPEWVHELCRAHFLEPIPVPGTDKTVPRSTTTLSKDEFADYILQIQELAAIKNIFIPDPVQ
jgi:hypothetical protein